MLFWVCHMHLYRLNVRICLYQIRFFNVWKFNGEYSILWKHVLLFVYYITSDLDQTDPKPPTHPYCLQALRQGREIFITFLFLFCPLCQQLPLYNRTSLLLSTHTNTQTPSHVNTETHSAPVAALQMTETQQTCSHKHR